MIRDLIVRLLQAYGVWTANEASFHGGYEPEVPTELQQAK